MVSHAAHNDGSMAEDDQISIKWKTSMMADEFRIYDNFCPECSKTGALISLIGVLKDIEQIGRAHV